METYQQHQLDALGDPTRRAILAQLVDGPKAVVELAHEFPVSRPAISQHLRVLKIANLVKDKPEGNRRLYQLNPEGFATVREYLEQFWGQALSAFRRKVEEFPAVGEPAQVVNKTKRPAARTAQNSKSKSTSRKKQEEQ